MTFNLPSEYADILNNAVASGAFASPADALRHALELFAAELPIDDEQTKLDRWNQRNQTSIEQSNQGLSKPLNDGLVIERLNIRFAESQSQH